MSVESAARYWISTVSLEHVLVGVEGNFCQVCHGKKAPLARMKKDDWLIYYSPKLSMGGTEAHQKFTAIGRIADNNIYQFKMAENFIPFRRKVTYLKNVQEQSIRPLLNDLSFTAGKKNWGYKFFLGLFEIPREDFELIYKKMMTSEDAISTEKPSKKRNVETMLENPPELTIQKKAKG